MKYGILICVTLGFSAIDICTGYICALYKNEVKSAKMRSGLLKKAILVMVIAAMALLQYAQTLVDLGINIPILTATCAFVILMEVTSIFENANGLLDGKLTALIDRVLKKEE